MKYYLYISDAKLEMLHPQIRKSFWKEVKAELGIAFIANAKVSVAKEASDKVNVKLREVIRELNRKGMIGSIEQPKEYFSGTMFMRSSDYAIEMLLYGGFNEEAKTTVALGGSRKHLVGNLPSEISPLWHAGSDLDAIMFHVGSLLVEHDVIESWVVEQNLMRFQNSTQKRNPVWYVHYAVGCLKEYNVKYEQISEKSIRELIDSASEKKKGAPKIVGSVEKKVEFVAKTLLYDDYGMHKEEKVLVGTPLYIALAE